MAGNSDYDSGMPDALTGNLPIRGVVYWGGGHLPRDSFPGLPYLRRWAVDSQLISDPDLQFVSTGDVEELRSVVGGDADFMVAVHICESPLGGLEYLEYPFIPVRSLIKANLLVRLVYWRLEGAERVDPDSDAVPGIIRFGFWLDGTHLEIASESAGIIVNRKFREAFRELRDRFETRTVQEGGTTQGIEIVPEGAVSARFFRTGRSNDVEFISQE